MADGFTSLWDRALTMPTGQSLLGAIRGEDYDATPQGQETLRNLQAQGYMGQGDISQGIVQQRVGLGALLQKIGILDEPAPIPATPTEQYAYSLGQHARSQQGFEDMKEREVLRMAQQESRQGEYKDALESAGKGAGVPHDVFPDVSEADMYGVSQYGESEAKKRLLDEQYKQALIDAMGTKGTTTIPELAANAAKSPQNKMLAKMAADERTAGFAAKDASDPDTALKHFQRAKSYEDQMALAGQVAAAGYGLNPKQAAAFTHLQLGRMPTMPTGEAYGLDPNFAATLAADPAKNAAFLQLYKSRKQSSSMLGALANPYGYLQGLGGDTTPSQSQVNQQPDQPLSMSELWQGMTGAGR